MLVLSDVRVSHKAFYWVFWFVIFILSFQL